MIRKLVCSIFLLTLAIGVVTGEEFFANITKIEGKDVTFFKTKKGKKEGEAMTMPVAKGVTVKKGTISFKDMKLNVEVGDAIDGGIKSETFTKIDEKKGLSVRITTDDDKKQITQILVTTFEFKKKKDKDK